MSVIILAIFKLLNMLKCVIIVMKSLYYNRLLNLKKCIKIETFNFNNYRYFYFQVFVILYVILPSAS